MPPDDQLYSLALSLHLGPLYQIKSAKASSFARLHICSLHICSFAHYLVSVSGQNSGEDEGRAQQVHLFCGAPSHGVELCPHQLILSISSLPVQQHLSNSLFLVLSSKVALSISLDSIKSVTMALELVYTNKVVILSSQD